MMVRMTGGLVALALTFAAGMALAQQPATPNEAPAAAPQLPIGTPPAIPAQPPQAQAPSTGSTPAPAQAQGPANICKELVAYLQPKPPAPPVPGAAPAAASAQPTKPPSITLARAEELAAGNDILGCRDAAQVLRKEGAPMSAALLALAALKPELLTQAAP